MQTRLLIYWLLPLVLFLFSPPIASSRSKPRGQCCSGFCGAQDTDENGNTLPDDILEQPDGISEDGTAGISFEIECAQIKLEPEGGDCSKKDMEASKGKRIAGRFGTNWELTADTSVDAMLDAEYIIDGKTVKLGTGAAKQAAVDIANDLHNWNPHVGMNGIVIDQSACNNWKIKGPEKSGDANTLTWAPQVTAPMPLEAIQELFRKIWSKVEDELSSLLPVKKEVREGIRETMTHVTTDFFQASPGGLSGNAVKDDTLGFFSLVLSYAKANKEGDDDDSIKHVTAIMPRNDFISKYGLLKDQDRIPSSEGSLFDLFKILACYKNKDDGTVEFDNEFCNGDAKNPEPIDKILENKVYTRGGQSCTMKEWINAIEGGRDKKDCLCEVDKKVDASIGHFGNKWEKVLNTNRQMPLFEFRRLPGIKVDQLEKAVEDAEEEIISMHAKYADIPKKLRRSGNAKSSRMARNAPRDACPSPTSTSGASTTAPPPTPAPTIGCTMQDPNPDRGVTDFACVCGSTTLPLLTISDATAMSQSCSYSALPTTSVANPVSTELETFTSNCYACTLVGGYLDAPTCASKPIGGCTPTTPATPTATVFVSNNTLPIGDENNFDSGAKLRNEGYQKLKELCPDGANACDSKTKAEIDSIKTVVGNEEGDETLKLTIQDSSYGSTQERDRLLAAAVASWQSAVAKSCKEVEYEEPEELTASGCGDSPVRRGTLERALMTLEERRLKPRNALPAPICEDCSMKPPPACHYKATVCAGPDHINPILANATNPYANHMNIQLEFSLGHGTSAFNEFLCELIIETLTGAAMLVAPELATAEIWEDLELVVMCENLGEQIGS